MTSYRVIITAVEHYIRNVAENVRDVRAAIEDTERHLLQLDKCAREHHLEQIEEIRRVGIDNLGRSRDLETRIENCYNGELERLIVWRAVFVSCDRVTHSPCQITQGKRSLTGFRLSTSPQPNRQYSIEGRKEPVAGF